MRKPQTLKPALLLLAVASVALALQFWGYLLGGFVGGSTNAVGYAYFFAASLSHAFLLSLLPFATVYLPLWAFLRSPKLAFTALAVSLTLLNVLAALNGVVFKIYKFHINGFVLDMVFGEGAGQIFVFDTLLLVKSAAILALIIAAGAGAAYLSSHFARAVTRIRAKVFAMVMLVCFLAAHLVHAYAAVAGVSTVTNAALCLPQFYPLTATSLMKKLGVGKQTDAALASEASSDVVNYPINPLQTEKVTSAPNIVFVMIDSWNAASFDSITTPNIYDFAKGAELYTNHSSSSNGTKGSVFGWFFSIEPGYWKYFESSGQQPLFVSRLNELGYDIQVFPSATLVSPPFDKLIFASVPNLRTSTPGDHAMHRDNNLTALFADYIHNRDSCDKPFMAFLFYDLTHAINLPKGYPRKFNPSWEFADYLSVNNETDPVPFFNLYRNCVAHVDSLVGKALRAISEAGLKENTLIFISGDHSQEFNENKKNFWGHNSNFSRYQLRVPLIYSYPGVTPKTVTHRTTHYDIVPTIMRGYLGVVNPPADYSMGTLLSDTVRLPFHIAGSFDNFAIITDSVIYEKKLAGQLNVTDTRLNPYKGPADAALLQEAVLFKNRFLK